MGHAHFFDVGLEYLMHRVLVQVWGKLHSFCIGLPGSPDLKAARQVADFLGTDHHEFTFTVQVRSVCF
jgi:asparagine synthase (glutamine-hydrolysing)